MIAVKCLSCGYLAEAPNLRQPLVGALPEAILEAHSTCDLWMLHAQLSAAAQDLQPGVHQVKTLIVTGDRDWNTYGLVKDILIQCTDEGYGRLVNGKARGLDSIARTIAHGMGWQVEDYPYIGPLGRAGGDVRNQHMLDSEADADLVLAFHDSLEDSRGTKDMVRRSRRACREVRHFTTSGACEDPQCICRRKL